MRGATSDKEAREPGREGGVEAPKNKTQSNGENACTYLTMAAVLPFFVHGKVLSSHGNVSAFFFPFFFLTNSTSKYILRIIQQFRYAE